MKKVIGILFMTSFLAFSQQGGAEDDVEIFVDEKGMTHFVGKKSEEEKQESDQKAIQRIKQGQGPAFSESQQLTDDEAAKKEVQLIELRIIYEQASPLHRGRVRRAIELREYSPQELANAYRTSPYDTGVYLQFVNYFSAKQIIAVDEQIQAERHF